MPEIPGRIIPARAGFTKSIPSDSRRIMDHPRSRGVYDPAGTADLDDEGSSPLARGLREPCWADLPDPGIIPARAGFTRECDLRLGQLRDHPRSRGVYCRRYGMGSRSRGSSPLARGLLPRSSIRLRTRWIIPARAGFTTRTGSTGSWPRDHPRSRGVYCGDALHDFFVAGSSPLARGLRVWDEALTYLGRIIPARAGFTSGSSSWAVRSRDHPRSRGVYGPPPGRRVHRQGSSPLARGLPRIFPPASEPTRIIPARAGFTVWVTDPN